MKILDVFAFKDVSFWTGALCWVLLLLIVWVLGRTFLYPITYRMDKMLKNKTQIEILTAERDAAVKDLTRMCTMHRITTVCDSCAFDTNSAAEVCAARSSGVVKSDAMNLCWQWRGAPKNATKNDRTKI